MDSEKIEEWKEKIREFFGEPDKGVHAYRIGNIAVVDVLFTIIGALIISYILGANFFGVLLFLFILGILLHRYFDVKTTVDKWIFGE